MRGERTAERGGERRKTGARCSKTPSHFFRTLDSFLHPPYLTQTLNIAFETRPKLNVLSTAVALVESKSRENKPRPKTLGGPTGSWQKYFSRLHIDVPVELPVPTAIRSLHGKRSNRGVPLNPYSTAVPFWGQTTWNLTGLSPKRDCGSKRVKLQ